MKSRVVVLFVLIYFLGYGQDNQYRFSVGGGFHSMMFWGLKDLHDVQSFQQSDFFQFYPEETYDVNYENFQFAKMYNLNFSVKWYFIKDFEIEHRFSFYSGQFKDQLETTLTDYSGIVATNSYYPDSTKNINDVILGVNALHSIESKIGGISTSVLLTKKLSKNFYASFGIGYCHYGGRDDQWRKLNGYSVIPRIGRGTIVYTTKQLSLDFEFSYRYRFINFYARISQTFLTTKKDINKGHWAWNDIGYNKIAVSHNFDFRFPLTFETGITLSFDRIK